MTCSQGKDLGQGYPLWEKGGMDMEETMRNRDPEAPYRLTEPKILRSYVGGRPAAGGEEIRFRGRLVGGCLDCLANLAGTNYDQVEAFAGRNRDEGIIWFLESCDLTVMSVRRAIWELKHAGWFSHVKGFLIGRPLHFGEELMGLDQYHAVLDLLEELNVPVIMDADLGHLPPSMPILCGAMGEVTVRDSDIRICYGKE